MVNRRVALLLASMALTTPAYGQEMLTFYVKNEGAAGKVTVWRVNPDSTEKKVFDEDMAAYPDSPNELSFKEPGPEPVSFRWQHYADGKTRLGPAAPYSAGEQIPVYSAP